MDKLHPGKFLDLHRALRQRTKPAEVVGRELLTGPQRGEAGSGVEFAEVHQSRDRLVVVAANEDAPHGPRADDDLVGVGAVADRIAEVDHEIVCRSGGQAGLERFQVAVNVAE